MKDPVPAIADPGLGQITKNSDRYDNNQAQQARHKGRSLPQTVFPTGGNGTLWSTIFLRRWRQARHLRVIIYAAIWYITTIDKIETRACGQVRRASAK
jgi:hypothetical protein